MRKTINGRWRRPRTWTGCGRTRSWATGRKRIRSCSTTRLTKPCARLPCNHRFRSLAAQAIQPHNHLALPLFDPFDNASEPTHRAPSSFVGRTPPRTPSKSDEADNWRRTSDWVTKSKKSPPPKRPGEQQDPEAYSSFSTPRRTSGPLPFQPSPHFISPRSPPRGGGGGGGGSGSGPTSPPVRPSGPPSSPRSPRSPLQPLGTAPASFVPPPESTVAPTETTTATESEAEWRSDDTLLRVIAALDTLLPYADVSSAIREGKVARCFDVGSKVQGRSLEDRLKAIWLDDDGAETESMTTTTVTEVPNEAVDDEWVRKGREICARMGIEVVKEYDASWSRALYA